MPTSLDDTRLITALILLVTALFLVSMRAPARHRPLLRRAAIIGYAAAVALALFWTWRWLGR